MPTHSQGLKKIFAAFCAIAILVPGAQAATFNVTNTADTCASGGGCLRDDISQSNAAGGTNTISWQAGSGGTITLGSNLATINTNTTLDVTNAPSAVTIAGSPNAIPLGGAVTLNNGTLAQPWTISAVISGAGSLTQTGAGTLVLSGANTYSGGTNLNGGILNINSDSALGSASGALSFNGGTLQAASAITSLRGVTLNAGGGTIDTNGNFITLSGGIGGGGSLTKVGAGTLALTGSNSYSGGTTLNAGTLSLSGSSPVGSGGITFNGGTLQALMNAVVGSSLTLNAATANFDVQGNTMTFSGVIGGTGALTMVSSGTLTLTGTNTYSGGTNLNATGGVLNINSDTALGTSSVTFNGGTLQAATNISSARNMVFAGAGTLDTNGHNMILSGALSGAGSLTKVGGGILTLTGINNTYSGGTAVNAGTLQLGASNALPTNGALTLASGAIFDMNGFSQTNALGAVTNSGLISMGAGTLAMGSYVGAGGTLQLMLQKSVTKVTVSGNANLTGGTLLVSLAPQVIKAGDTFVPITYGSNTGSTTFTKIISPAALSFAQTPNAGNLTLTASLVPFANIAASSNQAAIGNVLEPFRANPTGDMATVLGNLYTLNAAQLQAAMDQISPVSLAAMSGIGMAGSSVQSAAVSQRMAVLADGADHGGLSSYTVSRPSPYPGTLTASALGDTETSDQNEAKDWGSGSPWGFFTAGVITGGRLAEANSGSGLQPGYAFNTGGLTAGADYRLSEHLAVGASGGYLHGHASIYAPSAGTVDNNSARFGLYATGYGDGLHADLYIGGAADFFATNRGILFGSIARSATAQPRGTEFNAHPSVSYDTKIRDWGTFSPFAGLNYDRLMVGSFTENGADALNLSVGPQTAESLKSSLGLRWSDKFEGESRIFRPYVSLGWRHEFANQSRPINAQLAGGSPFSVKTGEYAHNGTLVGTGFSVAWGQATLRLDYSGDFRSHFQDSMVNTSLRCKF